jgi:CP family cyanate transporter-like MFS transporter
MEKPGSAASGVDEQVVARARVGVASTRRTHWPAALAAITCGGVAAMNIGKVAIALPQLRTDLQLTLIAAGWVASMFNTIAVLSGVFFGMLGDRFGPLRICFAGLLSSIAAGLLGIFSRTEGLLLFSRFLEGVGFLLIAVSGPALVTAASAPEKLRLALGIWSTFIPAGISIVMLAAPLLLGYGWQAIWWFVLFCLLLSTSFLFRSRNHYAAGAPRERARLADIKAALRQPLVWWLALALCLYAIQFFAVVIWLPTYLKEERDLPALAISLLSAVVILVNVPGNLSAERSRSPQFRSRPAHRLRVRG